MVLTGMQLILGASWVWGWGEPWRAEPLRAVGLCDMFTAELSLQQEKSAPSVSE